MGRFFGGGHSVGASVQQCSNCESDSIGTVLYVHCVLINCLIESCSLPPVC